MEKVDKPAKSIQSVQRALDILEFLFEGGNGFRLSKIAEECQLNKTTAFHLLKTLESRGYVEQSFDTQLYKPGWKLYSIAAKMFSNQNIVQAGRPYMEKLFHMFNETVVLCYCGKVRDTQMGTCFYQYESTDPLHTTLPPGTEIPLHCTAVGRTYLMGLPEEILTELLSKDLYAYTPQTVTDPAIIREQLKQIKLQGYCVEYEEYQTGVCSVAVPIIKYTGRTVFSIAITMPVQRATKERIDAMLLQMLPMAQELSKYPF